MHASAQLTAKQHRSKYEFMINMKFQKNSFFEKTPSNGKIRITDNMGCLRIPNISIFSD